MSDEIMLVFGEDGVARKYDDTWDITIHCESEEEQKTVLEKLNNSNQEVKHSTESSSTHKALDTISRQDAIEALNRCTDVYHTNLPPLVDKEEVRRALESLPSAQPEPLVNESRTLVNDLVNDTISRTAAIDTVKNMRKVCDTEDINDYYDLLLASFDVLPSVQPEPHWIPVSERLPESKPEDLEYPTVIACCEDGEVMTACYYESTKEWGIGENYDRKINPVAWMPLPEPYRAERRADDLQ